MQTIIEENSYYLQVLYEWQLCIQGLLSDTGNKTLKKLFWESVTDAGSLIPQDGMRL